MNNNPKFSIIVPVYNVEKYLTECIDSILSQSFSNYELLIIDDGSTDSSGNICDTYITYKNVKIFHKRNGGLSDARNYGLRESIGEYIIFVDSDDFWSDKLFLHKVNDKIMTSNPDIVIFGYKKLYEDGSSKEYQQILKYENMENNIENALKGGIFNIGAWDKIVRREIIIKNKILFRNKVISEDMEWCASLYKYCNTFVILNTSQYIYRQRKGSITKTVSLNSVNDIINNYNRCVEIGKNLRDRKKRIYDIYLSKCFSMFIIACSLLERDDRKQYSVVIKKYMNILRKNNRVREKIIYNSLNILGVDITLRLLNISYNFIYRK